MEMPPFSQMINMIPTVPSERAPERTPPAFTKNASGRMSTRIQGHRSRSARLIINLAVLLILVLASAACTEDKGSDDGGDDGKDDHTQDVDLDNITYHNMHIHIQSNDEKAEILVQSMDDVGIEWTLVLASPYMTIWGRAHPDNPDDNFSHYEESNDFVLDLAERYPGRIIPYITLDPEETDNLERLKDYIDQGACGLKLYSGHSVFYDLPLDHPNMLPVYEYCEREQFPILWHINLGIQNYQDEFDHVMELYPQLRVNLPHFGMSSIKITRIMHYLDTYDNIYTDISFGGFAQDGFDRISKNPQKYIDFMTEYKEKVMFGTDLVLTINSIKTANWTSRMTQAYKDLLETETFEVTDCENRLDGEFNGLHLPDDVLVWIYQDAALAFQEGNFPNSD